MKVNLKRFKWFTIQQWKAASLPQEIDDATLVQKAREYQAKGGMFWPSEWAEITAAIDRLRASSRPNDATA